MAVGREGVWLRKGNVGSPCGDGMVLYLQCQCQCQCKVSILVAMLSHGSIRCCQRRNQANTQEIALYCFLQLCENL